MSRPFGSKNKKPRVMTPEMVARLRALAAKRHAEAGCEGVPVRIDPLVVSKLRKRFPRPIERRKFISRVLLNALALQERVDREDAARKK